MFALSQISEIFLNPLIWVLGIGLYGLIRKKQILCWLAFLLLYFFILSYPAHWAMGKWEYPPQELKQDSYDLVVVLGGITPQQVVHSNAPLNFGSSSERFLEAVRLYQEGKVKKILLTGGSGFWNQGYQEAQILGAYAQRLGVPASNIIVESESRNTRENIIKAAAIIKKDFPQSQILLITSGYHIFRTVRAFHKQGIDPDLYPVDNRSRFILNPLPEPTQPPGYLDRIRSLLKEAIPEYQSLGLWTLLSKEILATLVYTLLGYI